ncbi:MAG: bifunctional folylpolyglutamate synthase/dihydrofolate synthase [Acetatifactor sp.]|nr:bifunctional folylpolyglutamate synthase/dihydrofolate synthase [Acetatifactor sp.]
MNERQVTEFIESIHPLGIVPGLDSIRELCRRLGDPQEKLTFVHVGGTNGKGSVCSFIAGALTAGGYRVGRYISPTIFEYRERIQVNGKYISKAALGRIMEQVKNACDEMMAEGMISPTAFEVETAAAFLYFVEKKCDLVVLEVGMGGTLDATNIVENVAATVLVSVSRDHMKFLGNSLEEIAAQKAGIMKKGRPVVTIRQEECVVDVFARKARELGCTLTIAEKSEISHVKATLEKQRFDFGTYKKLEIGLAGQHQIENAILAVKTLEVLSENGYPVSEENLRKGIKNVCWPGRFTVIDKKPLFIVDGAHNEDAAKRLAESIEFYFTNKRIIYIMGVLKDKEYEKVIHLTCHLAEQIITVTTPNNERALPALDLAQAVMEVNPNVTAAASLEEAVEIARLLATKDDVIIAFGSLSFLGRLMNIVGFQPN